MPSLSLLRPKIPKLHKSQLWGIGAALFVTSVVTIADNRIKADNTRLKDNVEEQVQYRKRSTEAALNRVLLAASTSPSSKSVVMTAQAKYAKAPQTFAGIQAFKKLFVKATPQIIRPLVEPSRSHTIAQIDQLTYSINDYASNLSSKENIAESHKGGLVEKLIRDFGPLNTQ